MHTPAFLHGHYYLACYLRMLVALFTALSVAGVATTVLAARALRGESITVRNPSESEMMAMRAEDPDPMLLPPEVRAWRAELWEPYPMSTSQPFHEHVLEFVLVIGTSWVIVGAVVVGAVLTLVAASS
ncbi:hypothetical protein GCM10025298_04490 [Natronobiforma cellulositropha]